MFKDTIKTPATHLLISKRAHPLTDKTNTVKKLKPSTRSPIGHSLKPSTNLKPSTSSTVPVTPHLSKTKPSESSPSLSHESPQHRLLYRTPVTSKRARRPPAPIELSPELEDDEQADTSCLSVQLDLSSDQIPDVEYGPPTACQSCSHLALLLLVYRLKFPFFPLSVLVCCFWVWVCRS